MMRRKRRKRIAAEWELFQRGQGLSDETIAGLRRFHRRVAEFRERVPASVEGNLEDWTREYLAARELAARSGEGGTGEDRTLPKKTRKRKAEPSHDPLWAKAKKLCRLNARDVEMAKRLGLKPRSLIKNIPGPDQKWKAPVKFWIRDLYRKRIPDGAGEE